MTARDDRREAKRQRRLAARVAEQRAAQRAARRTALRRSGTAGIAAVLAGGALVGLLTLASDADRASPGVDRGPFGQNYAGLAERQRAAGVPSEIDAQRSAHLHPHLSVFANGRRIMVPANIGIDPAAASGEMSTLHTHDSSGELHVEGLASPTLGQFFAIWGVALSPARLGPHRASGATRLRMWVDGRPSTAFGALRLRDGQRIVLSYGPADAAPPETVGS